MLKPGASCIRLVQDCGSGLDVSSSYCRDMLKLGASRPWPEALEAVCGTRRMSAAAILRYFQPLHDWLRAENRKNGVRVGWDKHCPQGSFSTASSQVQFSPVLFSFFLLVIFGQNKWAMKTTQTEKKSLYALVRLFSHKFLTCFHVRINWHLQSNK